MSAAAAPKMATAPTGSGGTGTTSTGSGGGIKLWDGRLDTLTSHITGYRQYLLGNRSKLSELPWSSGAFQKILLLDDSLTLKLETSRLRVAVIALVKSGKTTLINSLVGTRVLHESNVPATSGICVLRQSVDNEFRLFEARTVDLSIKLAAPLVSGSGSATAAGSGGSSGGGDAKSHGNGDSSLSSAAVQVNQCITEGKELVAGKTKIYAQVEAINTTLRAAKTSGSKAVRDNLQVILRGPIACLKGMDKDVTNRFELLDTPGRNEAANEQVVEVVDSIIETADVIVFVFNYTLLGTTDEQQMWQQIKESRPDLFRSRSDHIVYVINKFDQFSSNGLTRKQTEDYIVDKVKTYVGYEPDKKKMFFTSASQACEARRMISGDITSDAADVPFMLKAKHVKTWEKLQQFDWSEQLTESGLLELETFIHDQIVTDALPLLTRSMANDHGRVCQQLLTLSENTRATLAADKKQLEQTVARMSGAQTNVKTFVTTHYVPFVQKMKSALDGTVKKLFTIIDSVLQEHGKLGGIGSERTEKCSSPEKAVAVAEREAESFITLLSNSLSAFDEILVAEISRFGKEMQNGFGSIVRDHLLPLLASEFKDLPVTGLNAATVAASDLLDRELIPAIQTIVRVDMANVREQARKLVVASTVKDTKWESENKTLNFVIPGPKPGFFAKLFGAKAQDTPISIPYSTMVQKEYDKTVHTVSIKAVKDTCIATLTTMAADRQKLLADLLPKVWIKIADDGKAVLEAPVTSALAIAKNSLEVQTSRQHKIKDYQAVLTQLSAVCKTELEFLNQKADGQ